VRDLVSMAAAATERCRVWPKTSAQDVKCVRAHCRGAGSSRHPAIFPIVFGELNHTNVAQSSAISRTVNLLLLRRIVLSLAIINTFLCEPLLLPTDAHNVKKHRVIKTF